MAALGRCWTMMIMAILEVELISTLCGHFKCRLGFRRHRKWNSQWVPTYFSLLFRLPRYSATVTWRSGVIRYSDRRLSRNGRISAPVVCNVQQWWQWLTCPLLYDVPPITYAVLLCDADLSPFTAVWISATQCFGGHGRTTIACNAWLVTSNDDIRIILLF